MIVVLEDRQSIAGGYVACFEREGIAAVAVSSAEFESWFDAIADAELGSIEAVLLGAVENRQTVVGRVRTSCKAPIIGILDGRALSDTLQLFSSGVDDVVVKPFHVREILARIGAIRRRTMQSDDSVEIGGIRVFFDGQDPLINGEPLLLPRRERRILEYLVLSRNLRVTKTQIFNRVYGVFNEGIHENVIESHISRLRKRLKQRLGHDPIESQRYLGYRLISAEGRATEGVAEAALTSPTQAESDPLVSNTSPDEENFDGSLRRDDHKRVRYVCAG